MNKSPEEQQREQYRREFLGNITHELRTPLFTTQGYITTLLDSPLDDKALVVRYLERAERGLDRMITIVNDLEEISRFESGRELERERFDIAAMAREIAEDAAMEAEKKQITIHIGAGQAMVFAERKSIGQVLWNLLMNSIKYGREGGRTAISFTPQGEKIRVEVEDNGIGIAPEELPRIFERFYRSDRSRTRESGWLGGSGLGLSIVKHILEAHGEPIAARSVPGEGAVFSFTLPKK